MRPLDPQALRRLVPRPKVVYTDVDGTFVGPGGSLFADSLGAPTLDAAAALVDAHRAGLDVTLVSGRGRRGLTDVCRVLGMHNFVAELGSLVVHDLGASELVLARVPQGLGPGTPFEVMENSGVVGELMARFAGRLEPHAPWYHEREFSYLICGHVPVPAANAALTDLGHGWLELVDNGALTRPSPTLPDVRELHVYHLVAKGVSKAAGVAADMEHRSLEPEECVGVGDAIGDLELAGRCGAVVVPHNAVLKDPALAEAIDGHPNAFVAAEGHGAGWAQAVRALLG